MIRCGWGNSDIARQICFVQQVGRTQRAGAQKSLKVPQTSNIGEGAHIAFEIRCEIGIVESHRINVQVGVELREPAAHDGCCDPGLRDCSLNLGIGKGFKFHDVRPTRKRFGNVLHQGELLRTRKQELSVARTVCIYGDLEVPEQPRRVLNLINEHGRRMTLEKSARFLFSLFSFSGEIEGDKGMFREQAQTGGSFASLSGSGQYNNGPRLRGALQAGFDAACNPNMHNIRYNRIFYTHVESSPLAPEWWGEGVETKRRVSSRNPKVQ